MSSLKQAWATMVTDFRATSNVCSKIGLQRLQSKIGLQLKVTKVTDYCIITCVFLKQGYRPL